MMATNYATATYTEIVDMQTINGKTTVIGIHTPQGERIRTYLRGFFDQFRFWKYDGISSMVGVNAAQLPVDPLGLTGVQQTTDLMDPRDTLNPILFHGCHGESLNQILNTIYTSRERVLSSSGISENGLISDLDNSNVSDSLLGMDIENFNEYSAYYSCLTDKTWKKFGIQSGVKLRNLHPRVWKLARNSPLVPYEGDIFGANAGQYRDTTAAAPSVPYSANDLAVTAAQRVDIPTTVSSNVEDYGSNDEVPFQIQRYDQMLTNGTTRLGWLPTATTTLSGTIAPTSLPKLYMGILVLPPSYNVEQFLRFRITHHVSFRGFTTSLGNMANDPSSDTPIPAGRPAYFNWIDYTTSSKKSESSSPISYGETMDIIGGDSKLISDGVM